MTKPETLEGLSEVVRLIETQGMLTAGSAAVV
jgi:hypothetical protein